MPDRDTCAEHGDALIHEPGGPDMPSLYGRTYCPTCQARFAEALDALPFHSVLCYAHHVPHAHGIGCHSTCPTCGGRAYVTPTIEPTP